MAVLYRDGATPAVGGAYHVLPADSHGELLDGDSAGWNNAPMIAWGPARWRTRFRACSTREGLVVRFDCTDEAPWATLTARDACLWEEEEVVEIFLDPTRTGRNYVEVEISPVNVLCDLRIRDPWPNLSGDIAWNVAGLESRVRPWHAEDSGPDGWTAAALLPWDGVLAVEGTAAPRAAPQPGDRWRFNVFRIKRPGGPADPERGAIYAAWSVPDGPNFHAPAAFRDMVFF